MNHAEEVKKEIEREKQTKSRVIAIDFDGTVVEHRFPKVGMPVPEAVRVMRRILDAGHRIILHTMRSSGELKQAIQWFSDRGVALWAVNDNPEQSRWTTSRKIFAHLYIDDAACGAPLVRVEGERPYVDWWQVEEWLEKLGYL